jgi:hypothetical protein
MVSLFNTCSSPMLPLSGILLRIAECWLLYVSLTWCNESNWDELNSLPSGVIATPSETVTLWPHFLVTGFAYQQEKSSEHQCLEGTFRSAPGILKSTKPVQFGFKNRLVFLWKPDLVTVVKTVFGWFLWFMDRLLPVLKIDTVLVFQSLVSTRPKVRLVLAALPECSQSRWLSSQAMIRASAETSAVVEEWPLAALEHLLWIQGISTAYMRHRQCTSAFSELSFRYGLYLLRVELDPL